jgi:Zn-dependent metalloprotease
MDIQLDLDIHGSYPPSTSSWMWSVLSMDIQLDIHPLPSLDASPEVRARAQRNLDISRSIRGARAGANALPPTIPELHRVLYNCNKRSFLPGKEVREEGEDLDLSVQCDDSFNEVWEGFKSTYELYLKFSRNSIDDHGMRLLGSVHFDDNDVPPGYDNAFFDGSRMVFGDGDGELFGSFTDAVDIIAHELTHGVTQWTADLPYWQQSGALNESISDCFGSMVKQYVKGQTADQADWLIGEGLFIDKKRNPALRSMKAPGTAYTNVYGYKDNQPSHMRDYDDLPDDEDNGGVHKNSGIPNHAFFLTAVGLGGKSWEKAGQIWYKALTDPTLRTFAKRQSNWLKVFKFFAKLTVHHAGADSAVVKNAWKEVGVLEEAGNL